MGCEFLLAPRVEYEVLPIYDFIYLLPLILPIFILLALYSPQLDYAYYFSAIGALDRPCRA